MRESRKGGYAGIKKRKFAGVSILDQGRDRVRRVEQVQRHILHELLVGRVPEEKRGR